MPYAQGEKSPVVGLPMSKGPVLITPEKRKVGDGTPGPGRPKGLQNKTTTQLKDMILGALNQAGGQQYLALQAIENPAAFMTLIGKVLPTTLTGDGNAPIKIEVIRRIVGSIKP
jgi:hypothetical protein